MKIFDENGNLVPPADPSDLECIGSFGGQFDECSFYIEFQGETLDREHISHVLQLNPTNAWNAGERHSFGSTRNRKTRILDYGRWYLKTQIGEEPASSAVLRFFQVCPASSEAWQAIADKWSGHISLVGHASNFNREFWLSKEVIRQIADRGLSLGVDAYFDFDEGDK